MAKRISYQTATAPTPQNGFEFGERKSGTFSITVKDDSGKILYENKEEPFIYDSVDSLVNVLRYMGATLTDKAIDGLAASLTGADEAVADLIKIVNTKLKADAKSSAYQALVNKYKPLEGEKKETAQARLVANFIKLAGVSKEVAITQLVAAKALPEDYTVSDFDSTPLRRTKGEDTEE